MADYEFVVPWRSASVTTAIATAIGTAVGRAPDGVSVYADSVQVTYNTPLTAAEQTSLTTWMNANTGLKAK